LDTVGMGVRARHSALRVIHPRDATRSLRRRPPAPQSGGAEQVTQAAARSSRSSCRARPYRRKKQEARPSEVAACPPVQRNQIRNGRRAYVPCPQRWRAIRKYSKRSNILAAACETQTLHQFQNVRHRRSARRVQDREGTIRVGERSPKRSPVVRRGSHRNPCGAPIWQYNTRSEASTYRWRPDCQSRVSGGLTKRFGRDSCKPATQEQDPDCPRHSAHDELLPRVPVRERPL